MSAEAAAVGKGSRHRHSYGEFLEMLRSFGWTEAPDSKGRALMNAPESGLPSFWYAANGSDADNRFPGAVDLFFKAAQLPLSELPMLLAVGLEDESKFTRALALWIASRRLEGRL